MSYIFIDESGSIKIREKKGYFVISFLFCKNPESLRSAMNRQLMRMHVYNKYPEKLKELKFYPRRENLHKLGYIKSEIDKFENQLPDIRTQTLNLILDNCDGVYISILDNKTIREDISDRWTGETLGNYVIAHPLIKYVTPSLPIQEPPVICFDKGRLKIENMDDFYDYLGRKDSLCGFKNYLKYGQNISNFQECDSISEPCVWAADMVAGAYYYKFKNNDDSYSELINNKLLGITKFWNK